MCATEEPCDICEWLDKAVVKRVFCAIHDRELTETNQCLACEAERSH